MQPDHAAVDHDHAGTAPRHSAATALCSCTTESHRLPDGELIVVGIAGELDAVTVPDVGSALAHGLHQRPTHLIADIAALSFCGARGITLLIEAGHTAATNGTGYALTGMPRHLDQIWTRLWPQHIPIRYPSLAMAITALRQPDPNLAARSTCPPSG